MDGPLKVGEKPVGDDERSWLMGVNLSALGRPFPRVSRKDYHLLIGNEDEEKRNDDVLYSVLAHAFKPGSEGWNDYLSNRRGRREPCADGTGCYTVGRVAPPRFVPAWEYRAAKNFERKHPGVKQYSLAMTMADSYVRRKYDVSQTLVNSVRDLALTCPADAAATMQEYIQSRCESFEIRVTVGSYAEGVSGSRTVLSLLARKFPSCHSTEAELNGNKLFIKSADPDGQEWCVFGPVKYAESIRDVFVIASNVGKHETIHLYSTETARLGIDISIEGELVSPEILGHGRDMLDLRYQQASGVAESLEPDKAEIFESLKINIVPMMDAGVHCSTALQLQSNVALVNQHVVDDGVEISIRGKALLTKTPVGDDLWAVHSKGACQPWKIRPAVPGELASIMYYNGMEVTLSAVFKVAKNDGQWLLSEMVEGVYPGMSGGAVVAMDDMALLGIHCGEMRSKLKAAVITDTLLADSYDFVTETDDNRQPNVVSSDVMIDLIKKRGLSEAVLSIVSSMRTVETVGGYFESSGVVTSEGKLVAACGEGQRNVTTHEGLSELVDFTTMANGMLQVASVGGNAGYVVRTPQLGETAVAIVLDAEGPQITDQLKVVHVGPQGRNMQLGGFADGEVLTVRGACVMSLQDGAVLGVVVRAVGSTVFCLRPPVAEAALRVADEVGKVFPRLSVSAWEASKLTGVMAVKSDTNARMARIGESALRYRLVRAYAENPEIEKETWDLLAARSLAQSSLVDVCTRFQLHTFADLGPGEVRDLTNSEMATLVLAFVGLVDRYENDDAVKAWLEGVGLLNTGDVGRPALTHRSSGFNVLSDEGNVLPPADYPGSPVASEW